MIDELASKGVTEAKGFGNSMTPILKSGSLLTFKRCKNYKVGDVVFCKVKGRFIDAHLITRKAHDGRYLISNNHGHDNGWTKTIYGKVVKVNGQDFRK